MNTPQSTILNKLKSDEFINYIKEKNINNILVFGSVLTEEFNEESDVDLAVLSSKKLSIKEILDLELFL